MTDTKINEKCALLKYTINCDNSEAIFSITAGGGDTQPLGFNGLHIPDGYVLPVLPEGATEAEQDATDETLPTFITVLWPLYG